MARHAWVYLIAGTAVPAHRMALRGAGGSAVTAFTAHHEGITSMAKRAKRTSQQVSPPTFEELVIEAKDIIARKYGAYLPDEALRRRIPVVVYHFWDDPHVLETSEGAILRGGSGQNLQKYREHVRHVLPEPGRLWPSPWDERRRSLAESAAKHDIAMQKQYWPKRWAKLVGKWGGERNAAEAQTRSWIDFLMREGVCGYFNNVDGLVEIERSRIELAIHELLHAYSNQRRKGGLVHGFVWATGDPGLYEGMTHLLTQEVAGEIEKRHPGAIERAFIEPGHTYIERDALGREMHYEFPPVNAERVKLAQKYVQEHGRDPVLHGFFGGFFQERKGKCVPVSPGMAVGFETIGGWPRVAKKTITSPDGKTISWIDVRQVRWRRELDELSCVPPGYGRMPGQKPSPGGTSAHRGARSLRKTLAAIDPAGRIEATSAGSGAFRSLLRPDRSSSVSRRPAVTFSDVAAHTVRRGDNLSKIARQYTGDAGRWRELYQYNRGSIGPDPNKVRAKLRLVLPPSWQGAAGAALGGARRPALQTALGTDRTAAHIVRRGDNLSKIARRYTGDPSRWRELYQYNRGPIGPDPNTIRANQRLVLPPSWGGAAGAALGGARRPPLAAAPAARSTATYNNFMNTIRSWARA